MPTHCMIIDDEVHARNVLRSYLGKLPHLELVSECTNAMDALSVLQTKQISLLFLDIHLPQLSGTEFLRALKRPPKVIVTTAYQQYALEGYELDIVDYLMKPIRFERLIKAVNKAIAIQEPVIKESIVNRFGSAAPTCLFFRSDRKMVKVLLTDILFIESMKDYIRIKTVNSVLITKQTISSVEGILPSDMFLRVHRSFILSLQHVTSFNHENIYLAGAKIPLGKIYRSEVMKRLDKQGL